MFKVKSILTEKIYDVYDVRALNQSENGLTQFLIFVDNKWAWISATQFIPYEKPARGKKDEQ